LNKLSFLVLYLRLFPTPKFRIVTKVTIGVVAASSFSFIMSTIFQCIPVEAYWDGSIPGRCVDNTAVRWSWAAFNTFLDVWVCLMPLPVIHRLHMSPLKKTGVMILFALGLFVCVASAIRMGALVDSTTTKDRTWGSFSTLAWSSIEASCGLICTCIPHLRQPLKKIFPRARLLFSGQGRSSPSQQNQDYHLARMKPFVLPGDPKPKSKWFRVQRHMTFHQSKTSGLQTESQEDITRPDSLVKPEVCVGEHADGD
jgi:hypothetical protein